MNKYNGENHTVSSDDIKLIQDLAREIGYKDPSVTMYRKEGSIIVEVTNNGFVEIIASGITLKIPVVGIIQTLQRHESVLLFG